MMYTIIKANVHGSTETAKGEMKMNTREIKLKIHDESELFAPLDPDQTMI